MTGPLARRLAALALAIGVATDLLFRGHALGINVVLDVALLLAAGAIAAGPARLRRVDPLDAWLGPAALLVAACVAVRADPALVALDVLGAVILGGAALSSIGGRALLRSDAGRIVVAAGEMALAAFLGAGAVLGGLRPPPGRDRRPALPPWAPALGRGVAIAAPLVPVRSRAGSYSQPEGIEAAPASPSPRTTLPDSCRCGRRSNSPGTFRCSPSQGTSICRRCPSSIRPWCSWPTLTRVSRWHSTSTESSPWRMPAWASSSAAQLAPASSGGSWCSCAAAYGCANG